jgi:hypothetical protein
MFLHVVLTFIIGVRLFRARVAALKSGQAKLDVVAVDSGAYPKNVKLLVSNFSNQFESPMMWYAVSILAVVLNFVDPVLAVLSWAFLGTRVAHSIIHTGANVLRLRALVYLAGMTTIALMWIWLAVKLFVLG